MTSELDFGKINDEIVGLEMKVSPDPGHCRAERITFGNLIPQFCKGATSYKGVLDNLRRRLSWVNPASYLDGNIDRPTELVAWRTLEYERVGKAIELIEKNYQI